MSASPPGLSELVAAIAARTPAPGGGAAAAAAAALGAAAGAMAARYTTGPRWADRQDEAHTVANALDELSAEAQRLLVADSVAFAAVQSTAKGSPERAAAEAAAAAIPVQVLALCVSATHALATFAPRCNPNLISDIKVGIHLLAGAGRAAWATARVGGLAFDGVIRQQLDALATAEAGCSP